MIVFQNSLMRTLTATLSLWLSATSLFASAFDSAVVFNEVQYHPFNELTQTEWIEIKSNHGVDVDISGWSITGGVNFTFPANTVLSGNGILVIATTPAQIPGAIGPMTGSLKNTGETIRIRNRSNRIMDELSYDDDGGWPLSADGLDFTLSRKNSAMAASGPSAWGSSQQPGGTPGAINFITSPVGTNSLIFSEIASALDPTFFIELQNSSANDVSTSGWGLSTSLGQSISLPTVTVAPGGYVTFSAIELGLTPVDGLHLVLTAANGSVFRDARSVTRSLRGLTSSGLWGHPSAPSSGSANTFTVSTAIVINEIFYHGLGASPEQWVEIYNRSANAVDLSGWQFSEGVSFTFPASTTIPAGGYLVVAWDTATFATLHPEKTALGPFSGSLSGKGETITLSDANENIVNSVRYGDGGLWSQWADGGGSSLELRDPDADNSNPAAWDASDESTKTAWQTVTYSGVATNAPSITLAFWNELILGLLDSGEVLVDDVSVTLGGTQLIQNGSFTSNSNFWRIVGNHSGTVVPDPFSPANNVLKISAASATDSLYNQANTTLKDGGSFHTINAANTYTISFRAKWLRGSNRLHSRLYCNRLSRQTLLDVPATGGTPGAANSRLAANIGPTLSGFGHTPVVPAASAAATVTVSAADLDGVASVRLFRSVNGAVFTSAAMTASNGTYTGTIPGQAAGAIVQFYVQATDSLGAVSFFPPEGSASRALIQWADGRALTTLPTGVRPHNLRVIITGADATEMYKLENLMSNADVPCTIVWNESVAYYRAGAQLKGSKHTRWNIHRLGYNLKFPSDDLFLGVHATVALDRSGDSNGAPGQKEMLLKTLMNLAGGIYAPEDDLIRLIPAVATGTGCHFDGSAMLGASILSKTRLKDDFLAGQWEDGDKGMLFKYDAIYSMPRIIDPVTRVVTHVNDTPALAEYPKVADGYSSSHFVNLVNLGADKELYRWNWIVENGRQTDDYTALINALTAIGQTGGSAAFNTQTAQYVDVNAWLRATIPPSLFGIHDNYLGIVNNRHNAFVYIPPGGKATLFPWDMDYLNHGSGGSNASANLSAGGDLPKFLANPAYKRLYWGHMLDILNRSFNTATMTKWATHYSLFSSDNMVPMVATFLTPRANYALTQINAAIPPTAFAVSSPPNNASINASSATVTGSGWINVSEIRLAGSPEPLAVTWTGESTWSLTLPLAPGTAAYTINAYGPDGTVVGTTSRTLINTSSVVPAIAGLITIMEFNYNPASSTDGEEFIELTNMSPNTLDLSNCHFDETGQGGVAYTFPVGTQLAVGGKIIVVRDRTAYQAAYGNLANVAPNQWDAASALSNGGETLTFYAADGTLILSFAYDDNIKETDGGGYTMVRVLAPANPDLNSYFWRSSSGVPDTTPPTVATFSPADNATNVAVSANLDLTFNESIALGTGNITLKNLTDVTQSVIAITGSQVTVAGSVLTINPTANLTACKNYAVRIDATAIKDLATNSFPGIANDTTWNFTTAFADTTPPTPNPMTWATPPAAVSSASITMTATTASDPSGVEYYFDCTSAGGHDSGWQTSPAYTDTGLAHSTSYTYQVKARDKSSNTNETAASGLATAITQSGGAALIYEPFDYAAGGLNNKGGTTEVGLANTWNASADSFVTNYSLTYGTLPTRGGSIGGLAGSINRYGGARAISASALAANGLLSDGATLWFSVVLGYDVGGNLTNTRLGFGLANNQFSTANFTYNILDEGTTNGVGLGVTLGRFNSVDDWIVATYFGNSGSGFAGNVFGTTNTSIAYVAEQYGLVVGKFTWGATNDTLELFLPGTNLILGSVISTLTTNVDQSTFDTITWARGDKVVLDEIRFGTSYEAVIGAAAPSDYDQWAGNYPGANLSDRNADYDGDGLVNDYERIWGLNPTNATSKNPLTFNSSLRSGNFSYTRRDPALTGLSYTVWTSTNLVIWAKDAGSIQTPGTPVNGVQTVSVTVSPALLTQPRLFVRMRAGQP